jgi:hypothetical protein
MKHTLTRTVLNWFRAVPHPRRVIQEIRQDPDHLALSFWNIFLYAFLYSITVGIYYFLVNRQPAFDPWLPVPLEAYYLYQMIWTIPWGVFTWVMISGIGHLAALAGRRNVNAYRFEEAAITAGLAWVVPTFYTQWIPETFLVPLLGRGFPLWLDVLRIMVIPVCWQIGMTAIGFRETHQISWVRAIAIGCLLTLTSFVMFLVFIR